MTLQVTSGFRHTVNASVQKVFNVLEYGALADLSEDVATAVNNAIGEMPSQTAVATTRSVGLSVLYFPPCPSGGGYLLSSKITIPNNKNIVIMGGGIYGSRIQYDGTGDYAFSVAGNGALRRHFGLMDLTLQDGGLEIEKNSRNSHLIQHVQFVNTTSHAIHLQADTPGAIASIIGGEIHGCRFIDCYSALMVEGSQCDNWVFSQNNSTRCLFTDVTIYSTGWELWRNYYEQRLLTGSHGGGSALTDAHQYPHVNLLAGDITSRHNRYGNEVASGEPPREAIVVGAIGSSETGTHSRFRFFDEHFEGRGGGPPTATSAASAIRFNKGTNQTAIRDPKLADTLFTSVINFQHANANDGKENILDIGGCSLHASIETPMFNSYPCQGPMGSWQVQNLVYPAVRSNDRETNQLVKRTDALEGVTGWTKTNSSIAKDAAGPDGVANSAFTMTKSGTGSAYVISALTTTPAAGVYCVSAWFRLASTNPADYARLIIQGVSSTDIAIRLTEEWQLSWFTLELADATIYNLQIAIGKQGDTATADELEVWGPQVELGRFPTPYLERVGTATRTRPGGFMSRGPIIVGYASAAPSTGTWATGDRVYNTAPTAATATDSGWVCTAGGSPGTWNAFGDVA